MQYKYLTAGLWLSTLVTISSCQQDINSSDPVEKFWKHKEAIVSSALNGITMDDRQYLDACIFFEQTSGIMLRGNGTPFGWTPNKHTQEDFRRVQEWYKHNKNRLCWDYEAKVVKLCKDSIEQAQDQRTRRP